MRGAQTSARIINPDIGLVWKLVFRMTFPAPVRRLPRKFSAVVPAMMLVHLQRTPNRKLVSHVKEVPRRSIFRFNSICPRFGDDAGAIKLNNTGVPSQPF